MKKTIATLVSLLIFLGCGALGVDFLFLPQSKEDLKSRLSKIEKVANGGYLFSYIPGRYSDDYSVWIKLSGERCGNIVGETSLKTKGKFYCLPFVRDVKAQIDSENSFVADDSGVYFPDGFEIILQELEGVSKEGLNAQRSSDYKNLVFGLKSMKMIVPDDLMWIPNTRNFYKVISMGKLEKNIFDIIVEDYSGVPHSLPQSKKFIVLCWDCKAMRLSTKNLQNSMLFERPGYGVALDGGFAFYEYAAKRFIPKLMNFLDTNLGDKNER